jgi:hypothetical protein
MNLNYYTTLLCSIYFCLIITYKYICTKNKLFCLLGLELLPFLKAQKYENTVKPRVKTTFE